jgi:uncharacterized membrane protein SpoIIM required for sporulation
LARNILFGLKRVFFDRILERSFWTWRKHPLIVIPTMLVLTLFLIESSIVYLAIMIMETFLAATGSLSGVLTQYHNSGLSALLQDPAYSLTFIPVLVVLTVVLVLVGVIGGGYIYSSEYGIYLESWSNESVPARSILANGSRRWKAMAWTFLLSNIITWGPTAAGLAFVLGSLATLNLIGFLGSLYVLGPLFIASLILSIFTIYSYPAVMADNLSGLNAIRQSFRVASHNLGITLTYSVIQALALGLLSLVLSLGALLGLPLTSLIEVISIFFLLPILHLTKTMIYYHARPSVAEMPFQVSDPIWRDVFRKLPGSVWRMIKTGLSEGLRFVVGPRNLPFHALSVGAFVFGIYLGYFVSVNGWASYVLSLGFTPGQGNPLITQVFLPFLGIDIFLHNWVTSFATALAGFGFGAPGAVAILYTGFTLGRIAVPQLSPSLTMFLAIILPHGIIEIPSFLVAGSVGIRLGYAVLKVKLRPGLDSENYLAKTFRTAIYVAVGLLPFFFIAGMIEADVTPIIARAFGWTFPAP